MRCQKLVRHYGSAGAIPKMQRWLPASSNWITTSICRMTSWSKWIGPRWRIRSKSAHRFLDYRLIEFAARLPRAALLNGKQGKLPLRRLAQRMLPETVQNAGKRGFGVPLDAWFRQPDGQKLARERLLSDQSRQRGWWKMNAVEEILHIQSTGKGRGFGAILWRLLFLESWARCYLDSQAYMQGPPGIAS